MECVTAGSKGQCTCTHTSCDKHGSCCKCVVFHRKRNEIPGCFFTEAGEKSFDRSLDNFIKDRSS